MKVSIKYIKTGYVETRECNEIAFVAGRMCLIAPNHFSIFYPDDQAEITIIESEKGNKTNSDLVNSENLLETHLAKLNDSEKTLFLDGEGQW